MQNYSSAITIITDNRKTFKNQSRPALLPMQLTS